MKNIKIIFSFLAGIMLTAIIFFSFRSCFDISKKTESSDYYILTNQILKMNKMVVMEQNTSSMQKTKMGYELFGKEMTSNSIITYTKTNAQVSDDLTKLHVKVVVT